jgi:hypothetical protein
LRGRNKSSEGKIRLIAGLVIGVRLLLVFCIAAFVYSDSCRDFTSTTPSMERRKKEEKTGRQTTEGTTRF